MRQIKKIALMAVGDSAWQGGIQYITNIIHALNSLGDELKLEVHLFKRESQLFQEIDNFRNIKLEVHSIEKVIPPFSLINRLLWFAQRKLFGRINPRFENYFLKNSFDYVFPATLSTCGGELNSGSWIADFQYHHFPTGHNNQTTRDAAKTISLIARQTAKIILSSRFCEKDCLELFPVSRGKVHVMPFSVYINKEHLANEGLDLIRKKYGIEGPYVMVSNLFASTKNHKTLFEALAILRTRGIPMNCVCTGNFVNATKIEFTNEILQIITDTGVRDQLLILGLIPREHQVALYRMAMAMVQPSLHEGWSTCVEEARALGKVLVLSDIEVHREQDPDNPYFFHGMDPVDLSHKLEAVLVLQHDKVFPDVQAEIAAREKYKLSIEAFGENFLRIASI